MYISQPWDIKWQQELGSSLLDEATQKEGVPSADNREMAPAHY